MTGTVQFILVFFFNDTATTEIYTLSLHDALPISGAGVERRGPAPGVRGNGGRRRGHRVVRALRTARTDGVLREIASRPSGRADGGPLSSHETTFGDRHGRHDPQGELLLHDHIRQARRGRPPPRDSEERRREPAGLPRLPERAQGPGGLRAVGRGVVHGRREGRKDQVVEAEDGIPDRWRRSGRSAGRPPGAAGRGEDQRHGGGWGGGRGGGGGQPAPGSGGRGGERRGGGRG